MWPMVTNFLHTCKNSYSEFQKQVHVNPAETFYEIDRKTVDTILAIFEVEKTQKYS